MEDRNLDNRKNRVAFIEIGKTSKGVDLIRLLNVLVERIYGNSEVVGPGNIALTFVRIWSFYIKL